MADNIAIYAPDGVTVLGYVRTKERATGIHNEVVELNIGGASEDLWNGVLRAGTAAIGKLAANSGVDIGDVDVTSLPAITALPHAVDFAASETGQAIWTPASGKKFVVVGYHLSFSAAGTITVWETGTDNLAGRVFKHYGAANGGARGGVRVRLEDGRQRAQVHDRRRRGRQPGGLRLRGISHGHAPLPASFGEFAAWRAGYRRWLGELRFHLLSRAHRRRRRPTPR